MFLDRYQIGDLLAESERNTVRRARRLHDGQRVIIKSPTREYPSVRELRKLEFEYRLLHKLRGPGVIAVLDIERQSGRLALVLEDFGGERLPTRPGQGIALEFFFPLALGIVEALGQVHAKGVIHKDINPRNVLMNPETREVKLIDFSLSSELSREHAEVRAGARLEGTLPYLSPEQTGRMNRDLDYRTDYYSLGVTFFELLTGSQPFSAPDVLGYVQCHLSKPAPSARERNPNVPEGLARIVARLMAKNPDERYQSARGLSLDLAQAQRSYGEQRDVPAFELGRQDVPERFGVSQDLVGREAEVAALLAAFESASQGPAALLLVAGYSGVGKSSLIREIHRPVVERRANFVSGKFEQLERNTPYGALLQAFRELLEQVLTETDERLLAHRQRLENALGGSANVLIPLLPELGKIMGPQPRVAELPSREAQGRMQRVVRDFLRAMATPTQPLVIFLDDLQWTDGSTPQLLVRLLAEADLRHVLFIGAYRDNEVSESHLLRQALSELDRKRPEACRSLALAPLSEAGVQQIVARTLHRSTEETAPLAELLFRRTGGNPYFLNELSHLLYRNGAIFFDPVARAWSWSDEQIARAAFAENVVELMIGRLRELPAAAIDGLCRAACLGNEFDLELLARVLQQRPDETAALLWPAVEQNLLSSKGRDHRLMRAGSSGPALDLVGADVRYRFPHDRVLQAAYSLLSAEQRAHAHLAIGRLICASIPAEEREARVFDFIDHSNLGRSLLERLEDRDELSRLNEVAAQRARRSAAYATAVGYLETSQNLLSPSEWDARRARRFESARMQAECVFLSGQVERANQLAEELFELAPDQVALAAAFCLKAAILEQQSRLAESVATILAGLRRLGLELPEEPAQIDEGIGAGIGKMQAHLERLRVDDLAALPACADPLHVATTELLFQLIPPASQMNPPLFILAELVLFDLALTHGTVPGSAKNFMDCGIVLATALNDHARAYRMGKVAFTLLELITPTPLESAVNFVFGCFISHWGAHFQEGLDALARGHQRGVELGDVLHASYSIIHRAKSLLFAGKELAECQAQTERAMAYTLETGSVGHVAVPRIMQRALVQLTEQGLESELGKLTDAEFLAEVEKTGNGHFLLVLGQSQTLVHYVLGDLERAARWDELATSHIGVGNGAFPVPDHYLFQALLASRRWPSAAPDERQAILSTLEQHVAQLATFAQVSPANYEHKHRLASAVLAHRRDASTDEVLELLRGARESAGTDFLHLRAIGYELQAAFWQEKGHPELGRESLLEAYHLYRHWGARAKLRRMEQENSQWLRRVHTAAAPVIGTLGTQTLSTITASIEGDSLDLASAIKATHALSSELRPERLLPVLLQTFIECAAAQHGALITRSGDGDALVVAARASVGPSHTSTPPAPLDESPAVARKIVRYVARSQETIVLDDAVANETHGRDPHVQEARVRSLLCMPVVHQGRLLAVLYAENNGAPRTFTPARVILLRVIAGQAALSLANAELYGQLERKVAERTRQLAEQSREVTALLDSLEQGVLSIDAQLRIQPRYSLHLEPLLGQTHLAGRDGLDVLFSGSNVGAEPLANMRAALGFSFGAPIAFAEPNKVHWVREFQRPSAHGEPQSFEVDWTPIADGDDVVVKILVAVRDVTLVKQLRAAAVKHARDLDLVGQILDAGVAEFESLESAARERLGGVLAALGTERTAPSLLDAAVPDTAAPETATRGTQPALQTELALEGLRRDLHTLESNARLLGLAQLGSAAHAAEDGLVRRPGATPSARQRTLDAIGTVLAALDEYASVYRDKLGDVGRQRGARNEALVIGIAAQVAGAKTGALGADDALATIDALLARRGSVPLSELVKSSARMLPVIARQLGKPAPALQLEDRGLALTAGSARVLKDALIHAFTNAVDHGIEAPYERLELGKAEPGKLRLEAEPSPRGATLRLSDDGRGLNLAALRELGSGAHESDEACAERVFAAGVSTASTLSAISGRGVGLDAVRAALRSVGGEVRVAFTGVEQDGHRPFELVFELPPEALVGSASEPARARRSEPPRTRRPSTVPPPK